MMISSNGGYRREEKSRKHWLVSTKLWFSVTAIFFIYQIKSKTIVYIDGTENQKKLGLSQMN